MSGPFHALAVAVLVANGCGPAAVPATEGEACSGDRSCEQGLLCVRDVGEEYGAARQDDVCERARLVYDFVQFGERGENRRIDEALGMIDGVYRLPRARESDPDLATKSHPFALADGTPVRCRGTARDATERDCQVPDWPAYYGSDVPKYDRFILFGLRMAGALSYVREQAPAASLQARFRELTGRGLERAALERLRLDAGNTALAIIDSFVQHGHRPYALHQLPDCYSGASGYRNPNAAWAPELDQLDPVVGQSTGGGLILTADVPVDCEGLNDLTYFELRDSLWDPHATAYRALVLAHAYQQFRGLLPEEGKRAWLSALRETGDALALPSGYEAGNNHGITQSVALIQLGHDLAEVDLGILPRALTDAWVDLGRHRLNDVFVDTVFPDGVQVEQSPSYHNYQLALLLHVTKWLRDSDIDLTEGIDPSYASAAHAIPTRQRRDYDATELAPRDPDINALNPSSSLDAAAVIDKMVRAAIHLAQPDGWVPTIGSSLPQRFRGYDPGAFEAYAPRDSELAEQLLFYQSAGTKGQPPPDADRILVFEDSGFVTLHSGFAPSFEGQTHVVFNTGVPYHRHSHADALAVHLYGPDSTGVPNSGTPLLIDPGWLSYRADGRHYFESTRAHNTVHVDGLNQCTRVPRGKRSDPYVDAPLEACSELSGAANGLAGPGLAPVGEVLRGLTATGSVAGQPWSYQSAVHGLYAGVVHRRAVLLIGPDKLVVLDDLVSTEPKAFYQTWHLPPMVPKPTEAELPEPGTYHFFFSHGSEDATPLFSLHEANVGPMEVGIYHGEPPVNGVPGPGWYSAAEDQLAPSPVVELSQRGLAAVFASVFLLGELAGSRAALALHEQRSGSFTLGLALDNGASFTLQVDGLAAGAPAESVTLQATGNPAGAQGGPPPG